MSNTTAETPTQKLHDDIKRLARCIQHWTRLATGWQNLGEEPTAEHCALCQKYFKAASCTGCPIFQKTGQVSCGGTPFNIAFDAWTRHGFTAPFQHRAEFMLHFLENLLRDLCLKLPDPDEVPLVQEKTEILGKLSACQEANQFQFGKIQSLEAELSNAKTRELHATLATDDMRKRLLSVSALCNELRDQLARAKKAEEDRAASYRSAAQLDVNDMKAQAATVLSECCGGVVRNAPTRTGWQCAMCGTTVHPDGRMFYP